MEIDFSTTLACPSGYCRIRLFRRGAPVHLAFLIDLRSEHMAKRAKKGGRIDASSRRSLDLPHRFAIEHTTKRAKKGESMPLVVVRDFLPKVDS